MKILIPYSTHFKLTETIEPNTGRIVTGGIEKFCYDIFDNFDEAIPLCITNEIKENRQTKQTIQDAINKHNPDMILFNNPWWGRMMLSFQVPLICIMHEPLVRDVRMIDLGNILKELNENGTHLYFVSPNQYNYHVALAKRIKNVDFGPIRGYVNSSYLSETMPFYEDELYDVSTVARNDPEKNPFIVHKKLQKSDLSSLVMTNDAVYKSETINNYVQSNKHWQKPRSVFFGLSHDKVLESISLSKVFVSTWPKESWGITTMEALGCGVPTVLFTDDTNEHASEHIAADSSHVVKIKRTCSDSEFEDTINSLYKTTKQYRKDIQEKTIEKHSQSKWTKTIEDIMQKRFDDKIQYSNLTEFM